MNASEGISIVATSYAHVGPDGETLATFDTCTEAMEALLLLQLADDGIEVEARFHGDLPAELRAIAEAPSQQPAWRTRAACEAAAAALAPRTEEVQP